MVVPPRKDAVLSNRSIGVLSLRNEHISEIGRLGRSKFLHWCQFSQEGILDTSICKVIEIMHLQGASSQLRQLSRAMRNAHERQY